MNSIKLAINNEEDTNKIAKCFADNINKGAVIALEGNLGSGKTTFVKYLATNLGGKEKITVQSPTYSYANSYQTTLPMHHLDLYRLDGDNFFDLGLDYYLHDEQAVVCVEWADLCPKIFDDRTIWIKISSNNEGRRIFAIKNSNNNLQKQLLTLTLDMGS